MEKRAFKHDEMRSLVLLNFTLTLAHVAGDYSTCKSDSDCKRIIPYETRCCRDFVKDSNRSCHNVSSCMDHFCGDDTDCGQQCCVLNKCTDCTKCFSRSGCVKEMFCCGKLGDKKYGHCRSSCLGSSCRSNEECSSHGLCCLQKTCTSNNECVPDEYSHIIIAIFSSAMTSCFIFFMFVLVFIVVKLKKKSRRRRRIAPLNMQMNSVTLTMPTTYPCTNTSDRKNHTSDSSCGVMKEL